MIHLTNSEKTELKRDLTVFVGALLSSDLLAGGNLTRAAVVAAVVAAVKVTARQVFQHEDAPAGAGGGEA